MSLSIYEFDKEREFRIIREDVMKLGLEEGRQEGIKLGGIKSFIKQALKYGETKEKAIEDASVEFGVTKEYIEDVMEQTKQP